MKNLKGLVAGLFAASLAACGSAAKAHDIDPFICGSSTNAKSAYVTITGQLVSSLATDAGGTAIPGFTMSDIDSGDSFGSASLVFNYFGTPNPTNGPYIFVTAHTSAGSFSGWAYMGQGLPVAHTPKYITYQFGYSNFQLPQGAKVDLVVVQMYPGKKAFAGQVFSRFNGATFAKGTTLLNECPASTTVPAQTR